MELGKAEAFVNARRGVVETADLLLATTPPRAEEDAAVFEEACIASISIERGLCRKGIFLLAREKERELRWGWRTKDKKKKIVEWQRSKDLSTASIFFPRRQSTIC